MGREQQNLFWNSHSCIFGLLEVIQQRIQNWKIQTYKFLLLYSYSTKMWNFEDFLKSLSCYFMNSNPEAIFDILSGYPIWSSWFARQGISKYILYYKIFYHSVYSILIHSQVRPWKEIRILLQRFSASAKEMYCWLQWIYVEKKNMEKCSFDINGFYGTVHIFSINGIFAIIYQ